MKIRLFKTTNTAFNLYIKDAPPSTHKIQVFQIDKDKEYTNLLEEVVYHEDKIFYQISGEFNNLNISFYPFRIVLLDQDNNILFDKRIPIINMRIPDWQKGMFKVKQHEFYTIAKNVNGSKVLLFKLIHSNQHCPQCWDKDLKSSNNSKCPICGGSGYVNKYSKPALVWGNFYKSPPTSYSKGDIQGKNIYNPNGGMVRLAFFGDVPIDEDDLVFQINDGVLYKIANLEDAYFNLQTFSYSVGFVTIAETAIEYRSVKSFLEPELRKLNGFK